MARVVRMMQLLMLCFIHHASSAVGWVQVLMPHVKPAGVRQRGQNKKWPGRRTMLHARLSLGLGSTCEAPKSEHLCKGRDLTPKPLPCSGVMRRVGSAAHS